VIETPEAPTPEVQAGSSDVFGRFRLWALLGSLLLAGVVGSLIGSDRSDVMHLEGKAAVGNGMASIESDGWFYGVSESVAWIDADGSFHEDGWPACLGRAGNRPTVRFGAIPEVPLPDWGSYTAVVYIDCRTG
jgi:hypothetical protein